MECNKEEAKRAKEIAERMMLSKDFLGARRIIQKAQRLDPDIEDISKMLAVCNVHCTSNVKINEEADWYGILQVNQTADDITIRKQYRKLALLLHPDKNNYFGAESAFKIIGEAQETLLDKSQRLMQDKKTKSRRQCSQAKEQSQANKDDHIPEKPASEFYHLYFEKVSTYCTVGEIWAFYCDVDETRKCYGRIRKTESNTHKMQVHVTWLDGYPEEKQNEIWYKGKLPSGCGAFKLSQRSTIFHSRRTFSHIMHHAKAARKGHYTIYPNVGEVWALYKNWSCNWSLTDLQNCEYDIVEVDRNLDDGFRVLVLSKVSGDTCVFRREGNLGNVIEVPASDCLKFSHRIPAFKLPKEMTGTRKVYWKLNPAAVPEIVLMKR